MPLSKVLLVEDEEDILMLGEMGLKDIGGLTIKTATNGREALDVLKTWMPDLIVMDVLMPELTGTETVKVLKQDPKLKDIPVFFLTAKSEDVMFDAYYKIGVERVFIKPFDPMKLALEITNAFENLGEEK